MDAEAQDKKAEEASGGGGARTRKLPQSFPGQMAFAGAMYR